MNYEEAVQSIWRHSGAALSDEAAQLKEIVRYATLVSVRAQHTMTRPLRIHYPNAWHHVNEPWPVSLSSPKSGEIRYGGKNR